MIWLSMIPFMVVGAAMLITTAACLLVFKLAGIVPLSWGGVGGLSITLALLSFGLVHLAWDIASKI
jgi:hypothetical protein